MSGKPRRTDRGAGPPGPPAFEGSAWGRLAGGPLLAFLAVCLFWGPFLRGRPFEGTESRRARIAVEMLESSDYLRPTLGGEATLTKPPLHYQLQALAAFFLGEGEGSFRVPALLLTALLLAAVFGLLRRAGADRVFLWGAFLLLAWHPILVRFAVSAEIDGSFAALTGLGLVLLAAWRGEEGSPLGLLGLAGLCFGAALMTKGPQVLALLLPALLPLRSRPGWRGYCLLSATLFLPVLLWALGLLLEGHSLGEWFLAAKRESLGRAEGFGWAHVLTIPAYLGKVFGILLPVWLFLGRLPVPGSPAARVLLYGGIGGVCALLPFPHRPTRYLLPALLPLMAAFLLGFVESSTAGGGSGAGDARARGGGKGGGMSFQAVWFLRAGPGIPRGLWVPLALLLALGSSLSGFLAPPWLGCLPYALLLPLFVLALGGGGRSFVLSVCLAASLVVVTDIPARQALAPKASLPAARSIAERSGGGAVLCWGHVPGELQWVLGNRARLAEFFQGGGREEEVWLLHEDPWPEGFRGRPFETVLSGVWSLSDKDLMLERRKGR